MGFYSPPEIVDVAIQKGTEKGKATFLNLAVLGFAAGMFIGLAGIAFIRAMGTLPAKWGSLTLLIGACVFPFGLICLLLAGGELVTGNMMAVSFALFAKKITAKEWLRNIAIVTLFNLIGSLFVAYFFGYLAGSLQGTFTAKTIAVAQGRIQDSVLQAFLSGIACNILVSTAVYLNFASKDFIGKIVGIWLPIMGFVMCGFQHVVANMFLIPAGILAGGATWSEFWLNIVPVFFGNIIGGGGFIAFLYFTAYKLGKKPLEEPVE